MGQWILATALSRHTNVLSRVPIIVAAPGFQQGQRVSRPAELLDIFPTLLELTGLPEDSTQEGQSLVPLLKNPEARWKNPALTSFGRGNVAVRSERFRYIRYLDGSEELYDHTSDPHEWTNLATGLGSRPRLARNIQNLEFFQFLNSISTKPVSIKFFFNSGKTFL